MESLFDKDYTGMSGGQEVVTSKFEQDDESNYLPSTSNFEDRESDCGSDDGSMYEVKMEPIDNKSYDSLGVKQEDNIINDNSQVISNNYTSSHDENDLLKGKQKEEDKKKEVKSKRELEEEEREKMQYVT